MIYDKNFQITKNFNLNEFFRSQIDYDDYHSQDDKRIIQLNQNIRSVFTKLQQFRDFKGESILILSGYRSPITNFKVGGVKNSYHMQCKAIDIIYESFKDKIQREKDFKYLQGLFNGVLHYKKMSFFHLDIRPPAQKFSSWDWQ